MTILRESIDRLGVLVPITVYARSSYKEGMKNTSPYVLLDGERRWRCVRELGKNTIPAIIVEEPTEVNNILTMFHIHNVREGWQLMPTALKLQTLMEELDTTNERELATITQLTISQIRRCKILLSYPEKYQNFMLAPAHAKGGERRVACGQRGQLSAALRVAPSDHRLYDDGDEVIFIYQGARW